MICPTVVHLCANIYTQEGSPNEAAAKKLWGLRKLHTKTYPVVWLTD